MKDKETRRSFLKKSSKIIATIIGLFTIGKYISFSQTTPSMNFITTNNKKEKILIAYESQFGSTGEVAKFIAVNISGNQIVVVKKINEIENLATYTKVIIGSAIQYDNWMKEARDFLTSNKNELANIPVAYFFTCLTLSKNTTKSTVKANGYADKLKALETKVNPISIGQFAGVLNYSKMSFGQRLLAKTLFAILGIKEGDYRDWEAIKKWSINL